MADAPKTPSSWYIVSCCILNYITAKHLKMLHHIITYSGPMLPAPSSFSDGKVPV